MSLTQLIASARDAICTTAIISPCILPTLQLSTWNFKACSHKLLQRNERIYHQRFPKTIFLCYWYKPLTASQISNALIILKKIYHVQNSLGMTFTNALENVCSLKGSKDTYPAKSLDKGFQFNSFQFIWQVCNLDIFRLLVFGI